MTPQNDKGGSKRLHIIGANEIAAIYDLPRFSAEEQVNLLGRVSPIAWQHINFHGRFEFLDPHAPIDLESVVQDLVRGEFSISEVLN